MLINAAKTKVMLSNSGKLTFRGNGQILEQVHSFLYLGTIISEEEDCLVEIKARLAKAPEILTELKITVKNKKNQ